jgi:DNA helicase-2/ATP-dependent DNA helicase PcrA
VTGVTGPYRVGDRVRHPVFGEGLILEVAARGEDWMLRISFPPPSGERRLSARAAPLEKLEGAPPPPPKTKTKTKK